MIYYTDWWCSPNPWKWGWWFIALDNKFRSKELTIIHEDSGGSEQTTNNRMELTAIIKVLEYAKSVGDTDIKIISDSQLCINTCSLWIFSWRVQWVINEKKNPDLLMEVLPLLYTLKPKFEWVRGHNGDKWNEYVDELCTRAMYKRNSFLLIDNGIHCIR